MRKILYICVLFLLCNKVSGGFLTTLYHQNNTKCIDEQYRGGYVKPASCDINTFQAKCLDKNTPASSISHICYNSLDDILFNHIRLYKHETSDNTCSENSMVMWVIGLELCEERWKFTCNSTHMHMLKYDSDTCDGIIEESNIYLLNTCLDGANTIYNTPSTITCHTT